ncbi:MAG: hypothetical protein Q4B88_03075 [Moraxella sp.]|nr:hypothetical protein [Moraxella sp.]
MIILELGSLEPKTLLGSKYRNEEQKQLKKLFPFIQEKFPHLFSDSLYISGFSRNLFDKEGVVFDLNAGDAIIFDKTIFHRSNPLLSGMMKTRIEIYTGGFEL